MYSPTSSQQLLLWKWVSGSSAGRSIGGGSIRGGSICVVVVVVVVVVVKRRTGEAENHSRSIKVTDGVQPNGTWQEIQ